MATREARIQELQRLLQLPSDSGALCRSLGISQPTFSRLWPGVPGIVALGAARGRKYALLRAIPGVAAQLPLSMVSPCGELTPVGELLLLQGGWYALNHLNSTHFRLYQGMPFFLQDLRPQGFLGRLEPQRYPDLDVPQDILRWTDEHTLKCLARHSEHAPGHLILGQESHARYQASLAGSAPPVLAQGERIIAYPQLAHAAMQGEPPGSSAGGEQPKFTALVERDVASRVCEHVIVKFSPPVHIASGRRWADLLVCEHLALDVMAGFGLPAARTSLLEYGDRVFLEVARFDRTGQFGRLPMATFSALDGDLGMLDQSWTAVAQALQADGKLSVEDAELVEIFDLYGALIGNVDKHHANIAVAWNWDAPFRLLPAYDMLPMLYRPNGHGEIIPRAWSALTLRAMQLRHLGRCFDMANSFWNRVLDDPRISAEFKAIAACHQQAIQSLENPCGKSGQAGR